MSQVKYQIRKLLDEILDEATWNDIMYEFYLRKKVELGLADLDEGHMVSQDEIEMRWLR
jgi:hypothetical protein